MKKTGLVAVCAVALAACSSPDDVSSTASRFLDAVSRSDTRTACALLTPQTREELTDSEGQPCRQSLPADRLNGTVESAEVWSDQALVHTDRGALFLTEFDDGWLVSAAGCDPAEDAPYHCVVGG
jgi:hypothetical protein